VDASALNKKCLILNKNWHPINICSVKQSIIKEATIDHVIPKSRGDQTSWLNLVICSKNINAKKGCRTPDEAGLRLLSQPNEPRWNFLYSHLLLEDNSYPDSWNQFLEKSKVFNDTQTIKK
jgi:CRISPR/Cas system Type II protein with McrA/HNH and RuvC-like nuclease domain